MRTPFRDELNEAYRTDRSIWMKIGGGAAVGAILGIASCVRDRLGGGGQFDIESFAGVMLITGAAAIGAAAGLMLALKDVVQRRIGSGRHVNPLLRTYFGLGVVSLIVWFITAIVVAFAISILTL